MFRSRVTTLRTYSTRNRSRTLLHYRAPCCIVLSTPDRISRETVLGTLVPPFTVTDFSIRSWNRLGMRKVHRFGSDLIDSRTFVTIRYLDLKFSREFFSRSTLESFRNVRSRVESRFGKFARVPECKVDSSTFTYNTLNYFQFESSSQKLG